MGGIDDRYEEAAEAREVREAREAGETGGVAEAPPEPLLSAALAVEAGRAAPLREPDRREILAEARRLRGRRTGTVVALGALAVAGIGAGAALLGDGSTTRTTTASGAVAVASPPPSHFVPRGWPTTTAVPTPPQATVSTPPKYVTGTPWASLPPGASGGPPVPPALYATEDAASAVGWGIRADIFTNIWFLPERSVVRVYITDMARQGEFLADMRAKLPTLDDRMVEFAQGARSKTACEAEMQRLPMTASGLPFRMFSGSANIECSELTVGVDDPSAAQAYFDDPAHGFTGTGIAVRAVPGQPVHQLADEVPPTGSARP
ncbi:hypothetical protein GCM10023205_13380 [Yinghuangia aomiensis]|uniref:Uncharacterized protein n=1 Tax=Yinghuangia aomiensis TaxID=676205 RepID=A0ABP9GXI4_9ACTN